MQPSRGLRAFLVWLGLLAATAQAGPSVDDRIECRIGDGKVTLKAHGVTLAAVLRRVALDSKAQLSIDGESGGRVGHWDLDDVPIAEAVARIAYPSNVLVTLDYDSGGGHGFVPREIYVFDSPVVEPAQESAAPGGSLTDELARVLAQQTDPASRRAAVEELGSLGTEAAVRAIDAALGDADIGVRISAVESLGMIGTEEAIRLVGQAALGARDPEVLAAARRVLESSRSEAATHLLAAIRSRRLDGRPGVSSASDPAARR